MGVEEIRFTGVEHPSKMFMAKAQMMLQTVRGINEMAHESLSEDETKALSIVNILHSWNHEQKIHQSLSPHIRHYRAGELFGVSSVVQLTFKLPIEEQMTGLLAQLRMFAG